MSWMPPKHDLLSPITGDDGSQTFTRTYDEFLQAKAGSKN